jgi:uncharacterized protein involved in exopolysaccharide biosynthesis/Mrp family chromosome partitioning ATPase
MTDKQPPPSPAGMSLGDIYFIIFRHKWKILFCSIAGFTSATILYLQQPSLYQSEAKLYVRYVEDVKPPTSMEENPQAKTASFGGGNIIASEVQILTSLDLANQVADAVGPEKILAKVGGGNDHNQAAGMIYNGLSVYVPRDSSVLQLTFQHPDPTVVQPVLNQLIESYKKRHSLIHSADFADFLTQKVDDLRSQLAQTESDLKRAKDNIGVIPVADIQRGYAETLSRVQQQQFDLVTELGEKQASLEGYEKLLPAKSVSTNTDIGVPPGKIHEYMGIASRLDNFRRREQELLMQYTDESKIVKGVQEQIALAEERKSKLEEEFPRLTEVHVTTQNQSVDSSIYGKIGDLSMQILGLQARTNVLNLQLQEAIGKARDINEKGEPVALLQRTRDLQEKQYIYFKNTLETARFDDAIRSSKASNINTAQLPSPPYKFTKNIKKLLIMNAAGGVFGGIALAFLIELLLDRSLKRPGEIEAQLHWPLILAIPYKRRRGWLHMPGFGNRKLIGNGHLPVKTEEGETAAASSVAVQTITTDEIAPWDSHHALRPFYEALRDRLMTDFENRALTHKPKLVAVTSCSRGSGVTSTAAGLAATLSETGDGNVLLVDMNLENGAAHPFYKGKPACNLTDLLDFQKDPQRETALIRENLYMAATGKNGDKLPPILPKRFTNLVPRLKTSDYDYIIFDMPPVTQTSATPRLAGLMDTVLLVVEAEKTDREIARKAVGMLEAAKAHVNIVFNKTRNYVPLMLHKEFLASD